MERKIKLIAFIFFVFNVSLWLNNISIYPSLCFPRFYPISSTTKKHVTYTKIEIKDKENKNMSPSFFIQNFQPYDKRFYMFATRFLLDTAYYSSLHTLYNIPEEANYSLTLETDSISL